MVSYGLRIFNITWNHGYVFEAVSKLTIGYFFLFFLLHCTFTAFNKVCVKSVIVNRITDLEQIYLLCILIDRFSNLSLLFLLFFFKKCDVVIESNVKSSNMASMQFPPFWRHDTSSRNNTRALFLFYYLY